jgi:hypothetical protein
MVSLGGDKGETLTILGLECDVFAEIQLAVAAQSTKEELSLSLPWPAPY